MTEETFHHLEPSFSVAELIFLQGWGEPLLHPRLWQYVERVRKAGPRVGLTTNGVLLNAENREALIESGLDILGVSLAGAAATTHDHFRGGNPLDTIHGNLRALREEKDRRGAEEPRVHIAFQLLASNLGELPGVIALARAWGAVQIVVSHLDLVLSPAMESEFLPSRPELQDELEDRLLDLQDRARGAGIGFHAYRHAPAEPHLTCTENVMNSCFVTADGDVSPCVMANVGVEEDAGAVHRFRGKEVSLSSLVFGNVNDEPLEKILKSKKARDFRRAFRDRTWTGQRGPEDLPLPCRSCNKLFEA
jgi:MoaA/NifB/PqqE/SkfB family radical SAM enzyme